MTVRRAPKGFVETAWDLIGAFHPVALHFSIGLLVVAAIFLVLRKKWPSISPDVPFYCLILGALAAVESTITGWSFAAMQGYTTVLDANSGIFWHRWCGVVVTVMALVCAAMAIKGRRNPQARINTTWQIGVLLTAVMVAWVGHQGGEMIYPGLYADAALGPVIKKTPARMPNVVRIDFIKHVAPILETKCVKCHGTKKKPKGEFRMTSRDDFFQGGDTTQDKGLVFVTRFSDEMNGAKNQFLFAMRHDDPDYRMPPSKEKNPITDGELNTLRKWVKQGAVWPDGFELAESGSR